MSIRRQDWLKGVLVSFINESDIPVMHNVEKGEIGVFVPTYSDYVDDRWVVVDKPDLSKFKLATGRGE